MFWFIIGGSKMVSLSKDVTILLFYIFCAVMCMLFFVLFVFVQMHDNSG